MPTLGPITRGLLIAWVVLWVASFLVALADPALLRPLVLDPVALLAGDPAAWPGVLGYVLLHDPTHTLHLLFNALVFAMFAPEIERLWPRRRFVLLLGAAALAGALATVLLAAFGPSGFRASVMGGSGLVAAMIAATAAIYPDRRLNLLFFSCRLMSLFLVLVGLDLLFLIGTFAGKAGTTAHHVHLAGTATGWLWAGGFWRRGWSGGALLGRWSARRSARRAARAQAARAEEERELDRILAKISSHGIGALDDSERRFLEKRSRRKG